MATPRAIQIYGKVGSGAVVYTNTSGEYIFIHALFCSASNVFMVDQSGNQVSGTYGKFPDATAGRGGFILPPTYALKASAALTVQGFGLIGSIEDLRGYVS